ncbi:MAG: Fic family protein [Conchiformibius sp.]|nr:Fic family protein [Conchiformibius sp.]
MKPPYQPPHRNGIYPKHTPESLLPLLNEVDKLHERFIRYKRHVPEHSDLWRVTQEKLRALWTYHSNAIEGSTLTLSDTIFFLQEGLTVQGKPLQDFLAAQNHAQTVDYLFETVPTYSTITEGLIQHINAMLLYSVCPAPMFLPTNQACEQPENLTVQIRELTDYIAHCSVHPVLLAAVAHYNMVRIHPFDDGNGRGARILMNIILMKNGYPPAVVKKEEKHFYLQYLNDADHGDILLFTRFIAGQLADTLRQVLGDWERVGN